jgi:hypothetical protein
LKSVVALLRAPAKEFAAVSSGEPQKLASVVKEMRSLAVSGGRRN